MHERENKLDCAKVSSCNLISSQEWLAMLELLAEEGDNVSPVVSEVCESSVTEVLLHHLVGTKLGHVVGEEVSNCINLPGLHWVSWVVAVLLAKISKDCRGLVHLLATNIEDWELAINELSCHFLSTELLKLEDFINEWNLGVGKKTADS